MYVWTWNYYTTTTITALRHALYYIYSSLKAVSNWGFCYNDIKRGRQRDREFRSYARGRSSRAACLRVAKVRKKPSSYFLVLPLFMNFQVVESVVQGRRVYTHAHTCDVWLVSSFASSSSSSYNHELVFVSFARRLPPKKTGKILFSSRTQREMWELKKKVSPRPSSTAI